MLEGHQKRRQLCPRCTTLGVQLASIWLEESGSAVSTHGTYFFFDAGVSPYIDDVVASSDFENHMSSLDSPRVFS